MQKMCCSLEPSFGVNRSACPQHFNLLCDLMEDELETLTAQHGTYILIFLSHDLCKFKTVAFRECLKNGIHAVLIGLHEPELFPGSRDGNVEMLRVG